MTPDGNIRWILKLDGNSEMKLKIFCWNTTKKQINFVANTSECNRENAI